MLVAETSIIPVEAQVSLENLLKAVGQLDDLELDSFLSAVLALHAERRAPHLPPAEAELLQKINAGASPEIQKRYDAMIAKRRAETLTTDEHAELVSLTKQVEQVDASRLELLAELARLRQVPLKTLIQQLGLQPRAHD